MKYYINNLKTEEGKKAKGEKTSKAKKGEGSQSCSNGTSA